MLPASQRPYEPKGADTQGLTTSTSEQTHLVDHVLELCLRRILPQGPHDSAKLLGGDCSISICARTNKAMQNTNVSRQEEYKPDASHAQVAGG